MDIILIILLTVGFICGCIVGAVKQFILLVAFITGFIVASLFYEQFGEVLDVFLSMPSLSKVFAFVILWCIVLIIAKIVSSLLSSVLNSLPAIGFLNHLLGGILGVANTAILLGAFIWLFLSLDLMKEETVQKSQLCLDLKAFPEFVYNTLNGSSKPSIQAELEEQLQ